MDYLSPEALSYDEEARNLESKLRMIAPRMNLTVLRAHRANSPYEFMICSDHVIDGDAVHAELTISYEGARYQKLLITTVRSLAYAIGAKLLREMG